MDDARPGQLNPAKPYEKPRLRIFGAMSRLTSSGTGMQTEDMKGNSGQCFTNAAKARC
jgi:hypothetical protein